MGRDLFLRPEGAEVLEEARKLGWEKPVFELSAEELSRTSLAQPAIFLVEWVSFLVAKKLRAPDAVLGHSLGEFAALAAAEALSWPEAFSLVLLRGKLMEEAAGKFPGGMLALLGLPPREAERIAQESGCFVANLNAPTQVVLAGKQENLKKAEEMAQKAGGKAVPLAVAGAFHSPFMAEAAQRLASALEELPFRPPKITFISSSTGSVERDPQRIRAILKDQMTAPVRWVDAVERMAELGVEEAWEVGPGQVLTRLGRRITERIRFRALSEVLGHV
jgi:[acyl-carrier-protein] S-malonyltransferase